ncbi:hypothetical protein V6N13_092506 [Hibiscus sabdariffa]
MFYTSKQVPSQAASGEIRQMYATREFQIFTIANHAFFCKNVICAIILVVEATRVGTWKVVSASFGDNLYLCLASCWGNPLKGN